MPASKPIVKAAIRASIEGIGEKGPDDLMIVRPVIPSIDSGVRREGESALPPPARLVARET